MPAFTKGKWIDCGDYTIGVEDENGYIKYYICECESVDFHITDEEVRANARLIAAAPELYEAVCDLLDYAYEALHWAGGENEIRGKAPRILRDIQEYQELLAHIAGKDTDDSHA